MLSPADLHEYFVVSIIHYIIIKRQTFVALQKEKILIKTLTFRLDILYYQFHLQQTIVIL